MRGRFAPSPTGDLHLGNLRTALLAWLFARSAGSDFVLRFEDLDLAAVRPDSYDTQRRDLEALGLDWDDEMRQRDDPDRYRVVVDDLRARDLTYECFCSRRDIREAVAAPHVSLPEAVYPGTCSALSDAARRSRLAAGDPYAVRLRSDGVDRTFVDAVAGRFTGPVDDLVIARRDGIPAYNLAVVIDDHHQRIEQVVRADDLLSSTPRQLFIAELLEVAPPTYAHVPLVLGPTGHRLAKRDGSVTLSDRLALGETAAHVLGRLAASIGLGAHGDGAGIDELVDRFDPERVPRTPWRLSSDELS